MWIKIKFTLIGLIIGVTIAGLTVLVAGDKQNNGCSSTLEIITSSMEKPLPVETLQYDNKAQLFGKIDINKASKIDLESLPGIGSVKAQAIIDFRTAYGDFQKVEELIYVPGISQDLLQNIMSLIYIK